MTMYTMALHSHSQLRWVVLAALAARALRGLFAWATDRPHGRPDRVLSLVMILALDTQFVIGLLLYFVLSPLAAAARANLGVAMADPILRFWLVEHTFTMIVALTVAHWAHRASRSAADDKGRHRAGALGATVALALVCAGIPWAFRGL